MSDLKSLQELQDMLKEAELSASPKEKHVSNNNKTVHQFVEAMSLTEGTLKLPTFIIYYNYVVWCRQNYIKFCGNTEFFRTFKKHCKSTRHGKQRFYLVNEDSKLDLTEEFNEKAKSYKKKPKSVPSVG
jgi:hypothetical protein